MIYNIKYFQVFICVYENLNMTTAAEKLHLTQPAVSRIIREMENTYNLRFFLRHSGKLYRTDSGNLLYPYACQIVAAAEQLDSALKKQKLSAKVRIGATPSMARRLSNVMRLYNESLHEVISVISIYPINELYSELEQGTLDFAIGENLRATPELMVEKIGSYNQIIIAKKDFDMTSPIPLFVLDVSLLQRYAIEDELLDANIPYVIQGRCCNVESIIECVENGLGAGIVPPEYFTDKDNLQQVNTADSNLSLDVFIAFHRKKFFFPELQRLLYFVSGQILD